MIAQPRPAARRQAKTRWLIFAIPTVLVALPVAWIVVPPYVAYFRYQPRDGDIVFQSLPYSPLINAIEGATQSPYSHCGIVVQEDGGWHVYESCAKVERVSLHDFFTRGRDFRFAAYRLKDEHQPCVPTMLKHARDQVGLPYDIHYRLDDDKIYCSELIYKSFLMASGEPLGQVVRFGDLNWRPYRQIIEQIEGGPVPVERRMIPPRQLSEAPQLQKVFSYGY